MRALVVFLFLFAVAASQEHRPCMAPALWEANYYAYDHHLERYSRGRMAYDRENERVRYVEELDANSTESKFDVLTLHKQHARYVVDLKTRKCSKEAVNETFMPVEIHPDSTYLGDIIIGSLAGPGTGVLASNWEHRSTDAIYFQLFTSHGCIPIEMSRYGKTSSGEETHFHFQYFDVSPGIENIDVFEVPKECM